MKEKQSGDVFALKTLKKSQTLAQESVSFLLFLLSCSNSTHVTRE